MFSLPSNPSRFAFILPFALMILMAWAPAMAVEEALDGAKGRVRADCAISHEVIVQETSPDHGPTAFEGAWLPKGNLFRPLLADMKQPRFYGSFRRVRFRQRGFANEQRGESFSVGLVGFGTEFGIWTLRQPNGCDGFQFDISTGVLSQFNLSTASADLINTDFIVGPSLTFRRGHFSSRLRLFHQSSHLGDEFLLNNLEVDRLELSFEAIDLLLSMKKESWRFYAGGGYLLHTTPSLERGMLKWGFEFYGLNWRQKRGTIRWMPIFGTNFNVLEEQNWHTTTSVKGGVEIANLQETRLIRFLLVYLRGFMPFGQFFNTSTIENYGFEFQLVP